MAKIESGVEFDMDSHQKKMKNLMGNLDCKQYTLRVSADLYKQVKVKLAKDGVNLKSVLVKSLEEYIKT
mgnify:CR=1 FL=1